MTEDEMSVLKSKRHESTAEFVNVADQIFVETMGFLSRMSNRYQRLLAENTMNLASEVLDFAEKAQNIRITDEVTYKLRREYLEASRASVMALDVHMTHIWMILMTNPQGAFTNTKGETISSSNAKARLNGMADSLGDKIDKEKNLITGLLEADKKKFMSL